MCKLVRPIFIQTKHETMRNILYFSLLIIVLFATNSLQAQPIKVTLLGTGVPLPSIERFGPSILVEAGGQKLLFDCGRGASQRLWQMKTRLGEVNHLFITHLHSDHVVGIPDLWLTGWIPTAFGRRSSPLNVYGPRGTKDMMDHLQKAFAWDIEIRRKEMNKADSGVMVSAKDIAEGYTWEKNGVKVTPFTVRHADHIDSALGFRIDYAGRSVILSGDTRYSENLIKYAKGVDVVIHEVAFSNPTAEKSGLIKQILGYHTLPEEAGKAFTIVKPKLAVYSHIAIPLADPTLPPPGTEDLIQRTRTTYTGPLVVGEDLLIIEIGDEVKTRKFSKQGN